MGLGDFYLRSLASLMTLQNRKVRNRKPPEMLGERGGERPVHNSNHRPYDKAVLRGALSTIMELKFSGCIQDLPASDRLELLVDSVTDCAIYLLDRDGVIRTWNTGAERIKGYRAAEVLGQHFSLFFAPEDKAADVPGQILARASRSGRAEQEGWRIRKDGGRFWASSVVHPVRDARGRAIGFAKITRDMTAQREAQQALYESERRFRLLVQAVKDCAIYMLDLSGVIVNWNSG